MSTITDRKIVEAWGGNARIKNRVLQVKERTDIKLDLDGLTIKEAIACLSKFDPTAKLEIFAEMYYGDETAVVYVDGWIDATPARREKMVTIIESRNRFKRERDEAEFRRLQSERPELFK